MTVTVLEFFFLLLAHAFVGLYSSALKYRKRTTCIIWGLWVLLQGALICYTEFVLTDTRLQFVAGFVMSIAGQYLIFFATTQGKLAQRIFTMLTYSLFYCIVMGFFTMIKGTFGQLHPVFALMIQVALLLLVLLYFLRSVCPLCRMAAKNITAGWGPLILVNMVFLITVILSSIYPVRLATFHEPAAITFVFLSISILTVYPVIFSNINSLSEAAEKREMERQNKLLLAQIDAENAQVAADRQARHDRRHHNLVMLEYANNNDIESVREYLKNLVECETAVWGKTTYCENKTVNTVLTVYERRAKETGIRVKISANVSGDVEISPQDLVIVIANLFENAIHGTEEQKRRDLPIEISVKESVQRLLIKVENPCRSGLSFEESQYGVGIHSVIAVADKYDGMYDFSAEDGIFAAKISLNLK